LTTLDVLAGGRPIVGAGTGWKEEEFLAHGLKAYARRGAVTNEYLRLFKELWTKDRPEFRGGYAQVSGIGFLPKPVQRPHPPIWIGGHSEAALGRVALLGDGWMPIGLLSQFLLRPEEMSEKVTRLRTLLREANRAEDGGLVATDLKVRFR
jgi:alkanesulfonate monooxygenase SsuD/methylene tetrahydromethanopterin reductase-like flavin-dependent oxidoreductase (luciferase family)